MMIEHAIVSCLVERDGKFLIVQESRPARESLYNLPGGHVEVVETLVQAAEREVLEETGYEVRVDGLVGIYQTVVTGKEQNFSGPVFHAVVTGGDSVTSDDHQEVRWVTADEFLELFDAGKFWTTYPGPLMRDYQRRGMAPLDFVQSTVR